MQFEDCINSIVCEEIKFKQDTAERKNWFTGMSFSHPAKMILGLQIYLIERYSKVGETILDPMAGSGTALFGATIGRNVICVELEKKFCDMMEKNWQKIKSKGAMLGYTMGKATIIQGDSRRLPEIMADCAIFSPPYAEAQEGSGISKNLHPSITGTKAQRAYFHTKYSQNPNNIANLKYGSIDKIISSPPYGLGEGIGRGEKKKSKLRAEKYRSTTYTDRPDVVISSPPYEGSGSDQSTSEVYTKWCKQHGRNPNSASAKAKYKGGYAPTKDNIGNLKSDNYLEAMLQVYRQCHRVLKEKGLMVLVVKNFIRNKKIVRLDLDTIKLCEAAGFTLKERLKRKLTQKSFWRILYERKYPSVPKIEYEDVLVFKRADALVWNGVVKNEQKE